MDQRTRTAPQLGVRVVSGKFRSVVAHFLSFEPNIERRWTKGVVANDCAMG